MTSQTAIAQRSASKVYFDHQDMDYYFSWILGRQVYEGSDQAECYAVAERISDGDAASWQAEWARLAEQVEAEAEQAHQSGHQETARIRYLHASTYYRAPLFIMNPKDDRFRPLVHKMRQCFQTAADLFKPPLERIEVPFQGNRLYGYFWKVDGSGAKRPTLIVVGGVETWAEDCYFMVGPYGPQRGYNVLAVDLPGQGVNPDQDLYLEARMEIPVRAVVDYALTRPEVDPARLALFGFSWGGHIAFKAAEHENRLQAVVANPAMPDVFRAAWAQQAGHDRNDPVNKVVFSQIAWRFGLKINFNPADLAARFGKAYNYFRYGRANISRIQMPVLCLAGEAEAKITLDIAHESYAKLPHPQKKLVIFTREQGGEVHCQVNNLPLANGVIFDWLDEVLAAAK